MPLQPLPKYLLALFLLGSAVACTQRTPTPCPQENQPLPPPPDPKSLRGTLGAELLRQIRVHKGPVTETQASLTQSMCTYLSSRDEEPYTATQSRIEPLTILTISAKGMTRERAEALVACVPRQKVLSYGWDKVILANDQEGWVFDMATP